MDIFAGFKSVTSFALLAASFAAFFVFTAAHYAPPVSAAMDMDKGPFARGETLYNANCSGCHGVKGKGSAKGPPLVHPIYHPNHHADLSFHWAVERGVRAHHWRFGDMPEIKGPGKDDVTAIIYYIRALQKEAGIY